jgi:mono/diheme cytochrome c family protein
MKQNRNSRLFATPLCVVLLPLASAPTPAAAGAGDNQPPPAQTTIDFDHDILPILQTSCLRCHGPERPRNRFRLDNRESALKGGDDGVDILPGHSEKSPLLDRVASTNEDTQMPPPGKAEPLTPAQIQRLRAWIDQGAKWNETNSAPRFSFDLEPQFGGIDVHGDKAKFREIEGTNDGYSGGLKQFSFEDQINADEKFSIAGHFLSGGQDSALQLNLEKNDAVFIRAGFEQWRHYSDNIGGFDPAVTPPGLASAGTLELDEGRAWVDFGLTLPRGAQIVLGYEEQFRVGNESELDWGALGGKNIASSTETVNQHTDIIKVDVSGEMAGWQVTDYARVEINRQQDRTDESNGSGSPFQTQDNYNSVQGVNILRGEKSLKDWWLLSAAYSYSHLEGSDTLNQTGPPPMLQYWQSPQVTLSIQSHIFSVSSLFRPVPTLSLGFDTQYEWTHEDGLGEVETTFGNLAVPILSPPVFEDSNFDEFKSTQNAEARFTKIPWTVVFADARFEQDGLTTFEQGTIDGPDNPFATKSAVQNTEYEVRGGFTTSPRTWLSLNTQYRFYASDTSYNNLFDSPPMIGYPAFILGRTIKTDEVETKLVLRPASWLRTTLNYKIEGTDFSTLTDPASPGLSPGGPLLAGRYEAHTYGLSSAIAPVARLNLTGSVAYSDSRTLSFANNDPSVVPYKGGVYVVNASADYALNQRTDLSASYSFAQAAYGQNNGAAGVPLGLDYTRQSATIAVVEHFSDKVSGAIRYTFYTYAEPSSGGLTDYTAQGIFASLNFRGP